MAETAGILLCGGRSSRMGRAKAWLPWRGIPMAAHVASVLGTAVDEVIVVSSEEVDPPPLPPEARVVRDALEGQGPLAAIATGLASTSASVAFVTSTDAPFLTTAFVRRMLEASAGGRAAAPVQDGLVQTLAAVYPQRGAEVAARLLAEGLRRPFDLLEALDYTPIELDAELAACLRGFNTPEEYLASVAEDAQPDEVVLEFVGRPRAMAGCERIGTPVGRLEDVLSHAPPGLELCRDARVLPPFLVSLGGRDFVRDGRIPVGPGERVIVLDASAGG